MSDRCETLMAVEERRRDAWLLRDKKGLATVLDEDFVEINYFGRLSKSDVLENLFERLRLNEFLIENPRLHGTADASILSYFCREKLTVNDTVVEGKFYVASHFVRKNGDWKICFWQITPVRKAEGDAEGSPGREGM